MCPSIVVGEQVLLGRIKPGSFHRLLSYAQYTSTIFSYYEQDYVHQIVLWLSASVGAQQRCWIAERH
jgi:hypothetical protein